MNVQDGLNHSTAWSSPDTRGAPRVSVSWRSRILLTGDAFMECRTLNLSERGLSVLSSRNFPDGVLLTVALAVPDPVVRSRICPVTLTARVVFHVASGDQFRIGLQIHQIDAAGQQLLRQWVHALQ